MNVTWKRRTGGQRVAHAFVGGLPLCDKSLKHGSPLVDCESPPTGNVCNTCTTKLDQLRKRGIVHERLDRLVERADSQDAIELAKSIQQGKPTAKCPIPFSYVQAAMWFARYITVRNPPPVPKPDETLPSARFPPEQD